MAVICRRRTLATRQAGDVHLGTFADHRKPQVQHAHRYVFKQTAIGTPVTCIKGSADGLCCNPTMRYRQGYGHGMRLAEIEHVEFDHRFEAVD